MRLGNPDKFFALGAEVARSLSRLFLGVLVARAAGAELYSVFFLALSIEVILLTTANSLYLQPMATIAPGRQEPGRSALMVHALRRHLVAGTWVTALAVGAALALDLPLSALDLAGLAATVGTAHVLHGLRTWMASSFASRAMCPPDALAVGAPVLVLVLGGARGAEVLGVYFWSRSASALVATVWMGLLMRRKSRAGAVGDPGDLGPFRRSGRQMLAGSVANSICSRVQPFALGAWASSFEVALFGAASSLVGPLRMLGAALSGVLRPRLALHFGSGAEARGWRAAGLAILATSALGLAVMAVFLVAGRRLSVTVFGEDFAPLDGTLPWAAAYALVAASTSTLALCLQARDRAGTAARLRTLAGVVSLVLLIPACRTHGAAGAFGALLFAELGYLLLALLSLRREVRAGHAPAAP